ncbi:MAG: alpha/beta hydrolase [Candidatus Omnitrophica bacterium]|nr:alpha/beta hydrolase [Candidatus Omnitrophota bacterium]
MKRSTLIVLAFFLCVSFSSLGCHQSGRPGTHYVTRSNDQTIISYHVSGKGEVALIFVHGWSCDSRYWQYQIPYFSQRYKVITVDLAGHGHSGLDRSNYTMRAFGEDVQAVVNQTQSQKVILIGHSMGGSVIAEAANLIPQKVAGIIGIDTMQNVSARYSQEDYLTFVQPLKADFKNNTPDFVRSMFIDGTDPSLVDWVTTDMSAAPPSVAISAIDNLFGEYMRGQAAEPFHPLKIPVWALNTDLWPTDIAANRKVIQQFDAVIMEDCGHFLMLEKPEEFNRRLDKIINNIILKDQNSNRIVTSE